MRNALHIRTTVLPGSRIEVCSAELTEGEAIDLFVVLPDGSPQPRRPMVELVDSLAPGPRSARTWEEVERQFQEERNSWDR